MRCGLLSEALCLLPVALVLLAPSVACYDRWVMGYYVGYQTGYQSPTQIDFSLLTHIAVGPLLANSDGSVNTAFDTSGSTEGEAMAKQVATLAHAANVKAILMLGGAGNDAEILSSMQNHKTTFENNIYNTMVSLGFDGVDLDWEGSSVDLTLLVTLAKDLKSLGVSILTYPAGSLNINYDTVSSSLVTLATYVDQFNLMSYDCVWWGSGWYSWHTSPLYGAKTNTPVSIESSMKMYKDAGIPAHKLGMGAGFYAVCYTGGVTAPNQDLSSFSGSIVVDDSLFFYNLPAYTSSELKWDSTAHNSYVTLSTANSLGCKYVSFDTTQALTEKGQFSRDNGYGGVIIWTISQGYMPSKTQKNPYLQALYSSFMNSTGTTSTPSSSSTAPTVSSSENAGTLQRTASLACLLFVALALFAF